MEIAADLRAKSEGLIAASGELVELAEQLSVDVDELLPLPYVDIIEQIPVNPRPTDPEAWWIRKLSDIRGITIHHTLSHSPVATARYCIGSKGRPSIPYHFWVSAEGECWLCAPLEWGMWHDHTGHKNVNISVGMAGSLHKIVPSPAELDAVVRLTAYLVKEFGIPIEQVKGHNDRYRATVCPGWDEAGWRERFYEALRAESD
jgi:hypothetical protein